MQPYYKDFPDFRIDTHVIYCAVRDFEDKFDRSLMIEFREKLEGILFEKRLVDVKFHPLNWRYHRNYFLMWKRYKQEKQNESVFYQDFFLQESRHSGEIKFKYLTDDEKVQIVVPKRISSENIFSGNFGATDEEMAKRRKSDNENAEKEEHFDNLTLERRTEILDNWKNLKYSDDFKNDDNPYQYERWAYDIYSLYIPCDVEFSKEDREYFEFFFSWRLNLTDLYDVKLFLDWHLRNTFQDNGDNFKEFVRLLLMKYERVISNLHIIKLANEFLEKIEKLEVKNGQTTNEKTLTIAQKVLIMHFIFESLGVPERKNTERAKLIQVLSEVQSWKNLYDTVCKPFQTKDGNFRRDDLKIIRPFFENLELVDILKLIDNQRNQ